MDQEHKRLEIISRFVIFLPLIVVLIAFFVKSSSNEKALLSEQITPTIITQESDINKQQVSKKNIKLNLNGPYRCIYKDQTIEADISIKNKNVHAVYKTKEATSTAVIKGDCAYNWKQGSLSGEKMCGIGQYLSLFEMLSSWNIMSFGSLSSMISDVQPSVSVDSTVMSNIADSCKTEEINDSLFAVPTTITFSDFQSISPTGL